MKQIIEFWKDLRGLLPKKATLIYIVKEGKVLMAKVGSMSSWTCTCEVRAESARNQDT